LALSLQQHCVQGGADPGSQVSQDTGAGLQREDTMKPGTLIVAAGLALSGVAFVTPAHAQSARIVIGGVITAGPPSRQYPQYPQRPAPYPAQRGQGGYGDYRDGRGYGADEYALNRGYSEGYEQGLDASRDRDRYDPRREWRYRAGDRGYNRDYRMSRDQYRDLYRRGFLQGYDAGYRDGQRGGYRGYGGSYRQQPYRLPGGWR